MSFPIKKPIINWTKKLSLLLLATCLASPVLSIDTEANFDEIIARLTPDAEKGDAKVQNELGRTYYELEEYPSALKWLTKSAEKNFPVAQLNVAEMHFMGKGVDKNTDEALKWFAKLEKHDDGQWLYAAGNFFRENGEYKLAQESYQKAIDKGDTSAINNLGDMYENGNGVPVDYDKALFYYEKALDKGEEFANISMGQLYELGRGVEKDSKVASSWYQKGCDADIQVGCKAVERLKETKAKNKAKNELFAEALKQALEEKSAPVMTGDTMGEVANLLTETRQAINEENSEATRLEKIATFDGTKPVIKKAWLHNHLPEKIAAYVRIPNLSFLFAEAETPLAPMYKSEKYRKQVATLRFALTNKLSNLDSLDRIQRKALTVLLEHMNSPIEVAIVGEFSQRGMPSFLLATQLDYATTEALEDDLSKILKEVMVSVKPTDGDKGTITNGENVIAEYDYEPKSGKLLISTEIGSVNIKDLLNSETHANTPIANAESLIDESGQGLLVVLKSSLIKNIPIFGKNRLMLEKLKIFDAKEIAFGFGVANGQAKIKAYIDMPKTGIRALIPAHDAPKNVDYYGLLSSAFTVSLPDDEMLSLFAEMSESNEYEAFQTKFELASGIQWSHLTDLFGRTVTFVSDDNGSYAVVGADFDEKIRDLVKLLNGNDKGITIELTEQIVGEKTLHHLNIAPAMRALEQDKGQFGTLFFNNHYYWIKEGDALLISSIPQVLLARKGNDKTPLSSAYPVAKDESAAAFLSFVGTSRNLSQQSYYQHLSTLNVLSDFANVEFDMAAFPTADKLNFDRYGKLGMRINNGGDRLSIEFTTTNGAMDAARLDSMSTPTIAAIGILAAIALPAYQDYTIKAKIFRAYQSVHALKYAIEAKISAGVEVATLDSDMFSEEIDTLPNTTLSVEAGVISITFENDRVMNDKTLILTPIVEDKRIKEWSCSGRGLKQKMLPKTCR